jgi:site-specific DNA-methyltransferase (adenine-specific)
MAELASFTLKNRNPDVLTCIANLSSDEVFTPPALAKQMLDTLADSWAKSNNGASIWEDAAVTFLDPCTKSGIFLREIVQRLTNGLEAQIPDLQARVDHILTKQVFGIGITHLTSLLARRSVYCSKRANGKHSIASAVETEMGNIWFESIQHTWVGGNETIETADENGKPIIKKIGGRCKYCGASQSALEREIQAETHAYAFIHSSNVKELISELFGNNMQFDVIIGNPPYQLNDGGGGKGSSASPIYQLFVEQAIKLEPRFLSMVIPARWFSGGKGLDNFRASMLRSSNVKDLTYFPDSTEVFPGTDFGGGVCYFTISRDYKGPCTFKSIRAGEPDVSIERMLSEDGDVLVAIPEARPILEKIRLMNYPSFDSLVLSRKPFGFSSAAGKKSQNSSGSLLHYYASDGDSWIEPNLVTVNQAIVGKWKVVVGKAYGERGKEPFKVLASPRIIEPNGVCSETYLVCGSFTSKKAAKNLVQFIETRFFRFLLLLRKNTQNITKDKFAFIPQMDLSVNWTDQMLYKHFGLSNNEINLIEKMIRPMGDIDA